MTDKLKRAQAIIESIYSTTIGNSSNPASMSFYQLDTYRFFFLLAFMQEHFEGSEISQEYAISLVPKKYASRIKRLQVLKQSVQLGYINEELSLVDKRRRIYTPSDSMTNDFLDMTESVSRLSDSKKVS
jgi:hypothetical protein